jgi:predicted RNA-binding protein
MPKTKDKVVGYAGNAKPYVERALHDEELRDHVKQAYAAAREIYDELIGPRGPVGVATRVATDKEIQENLRRTLDELRHAAERLQGKDAHKGRNTLLLVTGITLGILFNPVTGPETRRWLKDKLFGDGGEFGYESGGNGSAA